MTALRNRIAISVAIATASVLMIQHRAIGQINFVNISGSAAFDAVTLQRIGIMRDGIQYAYDEDELISGSMTDVNIDGTSFSPTVVLSADGYPFSGAPNAFLDDPVLNRGMFTPGAGDGNFVPGDEFTEFTFDTPVVNDPGNDLVLSFITFRFSSFETAPGPYWLSADGATPTQIDRAADLNASAVASIPYFFYPGAGDIDDPSEFLRTSAQSSGSLGNSNATPRPSFQSVDLSDLGIAQGESLRSLRIWDDDASNGNTIYPTYIAGLPSVSAVPEPGSVTLLMIGCLGTTLMRKRRAH